MAAAGDFIWQQDVEYSWSAPVVIGNYVYIQDQGGGISCVAASDGTQVWTATLADEYPTTSPTYKKGKLYAMAGSSLYQIDAFTGTVLNTFTASASLSNMAPAVTDTLVFVSTSSTLYAVNLSTFASSWTKSLTATANVIVSDDVIYALSDKLYALNASNGTEYWNTAPPQGSRFNLGTLSGSYLALFSAYDSTARTTQLHCYQLAASAFAAPTLLWSADMGTGQYSDTAQPASDSTYVYAASREGVLRCFALAGTGTAVWTRTVRDSGSSCAIPAVVDGQVFIQDNDSAESTASVVCLDGSDGTEKWHTTMTEQQHISWGSPAIVNNVLYLSTDHGGGLLAFDAGTVDKNWYMAGHNPSLTASDNGWTPETTGPCMDLLKMTQVTVSGTQTVNSPVTITATAANECGGTVYYRFGIIPDYGTASYDPTGWTAISDYTTSNSVTYTFTTAGSYIFTATANSSPVEPSGAKPMLGGCITILEQE